MRRLSMKVLAVKVVMNALTLLTLQVSEAVHSQHVRVGKEVVVFQVKK